MYYILKILSINWYLVILLSFSLLEGMTQPPGYKLHFSNSPVIKKVKLIIEKRDEISRKLYRIKEIQVMDDFGVWNKAILCDENNTFLQKPELCNSREIDNYSMDIYSKVSLFEHFKNEKEYNVVGEISIRDFLKEHVLKSVENLQEIERYPISSEGVQTQYIVRTKESNFQSKNQDSDDSDQGYTIRIKATNNDHDKLKELRIKNIAYRFVVNNETFVNDKVTTDSDYVELKKSLLTVKENEAITITLYGQGFEGLKKGVSITIKPQEWLKNIDQQKSIVYLDESHFTKLIKNRPVKKKTLVLKLDPDLHPLFEVGAIKSFTMRLGDYDITSSFKNNDGRITAKLEVPIGASGGRIKFPQNEHLSGGNYSLTFYNKNTKEITYRDIKNILRNHSYITYQTDDPIERLPTWRRLFFTQDQTKLEARLRSEISNIYTYSLNGRSVVTVNRNKKSIALNYPCELSTESWIKEVQILDPSFERMFHETRSYVRNIRNNSEIELYQTDQQQVECRFYMKDIQRGWFYPQGNSESTISRYVKLTWDTNSSILNFPKQHCPAELDPVEIVYFDGIKGRDPEQYRQKLNNMKRAKSSGLIEDYCVIFAYDDHVIETKCASDADFRSWNLNQFGEGSQNVHLHFNQNTDPISYTGLEAALNKWDSDERFSKFKLNKTMYVTERTDLYLKNRKESLERQNVKIELIK